MLRRHPVHVGQGNIWPCPWETPSRKIPGRRSRRCDHRRRTAHDPASAQSAGRRDAACAHRRQSPPRARTPSPPASPRCAAPSARGSSAARQAPACSSPPPRGTAQPPLIPGERRRHRGRLREFLEACADRALKILGCGIRLGHRQPALHGIRILAQHARQRLHCLSACRSGYRGAQACSTASHPPSLPTR